MEFDRVRIKEEAKARMREANPKAWAVTLAYTGIVYLLAFLWMAAVIFISGRAASPLPGAVGPSAAGAGLLILAYFVLVIFLALFQVGYCGYSIRLWRREPGGYRDLLHGFSIPTRVLALWGLLFLRSILWCLPLLAAALLGAFLSQSSMDPALQSALTFAAILAAFIFFASRVLLYSFAFHVLLDHPDYTAQQALRESKALMLGQRWKLLLFFLSFIGWYLLEYAVVCAASIGITSLSLSLSLSLFFRSPTPLSSPAVFYALCFLILLLVLLISLPLLLWLAPYMNTALAGIYDSLQGKPLVPPAPPWEVPSQPIPFGD